jgi:hypothetical protein
MKRLLAVTILGVGLVATAGATSVDRLGMAVADGQPPPPPFPPGDYQKTPWLIADGQPPPPPGPWQVQSA